MEKPTGWKNWFKGQEKLRYTRQRVHSHLRLVGAKDAVFYIFKQLAKKKKRQYFVTRKNDVKFEFQCV